MFFGSLMKDENKKSGLVNSDDLEHLCRLVEVKDGGPAWIQMMDRSTATMSYQAWRRDPEVPLLFIWFPVLDCVRLFDLAHDLFSLKWLSRPGLHNTEAGLFLRMQVLSW